MNKKLPFSVSLVVPVYNCKKKAIEQLNICNKILKNICGDYEIIVSDDCSTNGIAGLLEEKFKNNKAFRLIFQEKNLGIAGNFQYLYKSAKKDFVMTFSADGDYNPHDIQKILMFGNRKKADLVIGKRIKKGGYTFYRKFISTFFRLLPLVFFGVDTVDAGSIKLIKRDILPSTIISESVFMEAEIIITAKRKGYKIFSYPVFYKKPERVAGGAGKFSLAFDGFSDLLRLRFKNI
jgi:glycosyltransferase involved in cell wall biosynthesis